MRTLVFLIVVIAAIYILFVRPRATPTADTTVQPAPASQQSPDHSNYLKRPLDRTHEVLDANRKRVSDQP